MTALYDKRQNEVQNVFVHSIKLKKIGRLHQTSK
jgi:hypothetical protein